jgi:hypothetical protein
MQFSDMQFLGSTPLSQPAPMSQTQTPSPKKAAEPLEEHGVLPVTARLLAENAATVQSNKVSLYGLPAGRVVVLGKVVTADENGTHALYTLNDETGTVQVQNYQGFLVAKPAVGDALRVVGEVRKAGDDVSVSVINLSVLPEAEYAAALGFHQIQVVLAECHAVNSAPKMEALTPQKQEVSTKVEQVTIKAELGSSLSGDELQAAIVKHFQGLAPEVRSSEAGVSVAKVAAGLGVKLSAVQGVIGSMVADGLVYTTVDEDHIQIV